MVFCRSQDKSSDWGPRCPSALLCVYRSVCVAAISKVWPAGRRPFLAILGASGASSGRTLRGALIWILWGVASPCASPNLAAPAMLAVCARGLSSTREQVLPHHLQLCI